MTEDIWMALIICSALVACVGILTTVTAAAAYSQELVSAWRAWRAWRKHKDE